MCIRDSVQTVGNDKAALRVETRIVLLPRIRTVKKENGVIPYTEFVTGTVQPEIDCKKQAAGPSCAVNLCCFCLLYTSSQYVPGNDGVKVGAVIANKHRLRIVRYFFKAGGLHLNPHDF